MSQNFKIPNLLSPRDLTALHARMNRAQSLDELHTWLKQRGYEVSRNAVANYRAANRDASAWPLKMKLGILGDAQARGRLRQLAAMLEGEDLAMLAMFASFLTALRDLSARKDKSLASRQRRGRATRSQHHPNTNAGGIGD